MRTFPRRFILFPIPRRRGFTARFDRRRIGRAHPPLFCGDGGVLLDFDEIPSVIELFVDLKESEPEIMTVEVAGGRLAVEERDAAIFALERRMRVPREIERRVVRDEIIEERLAERRGEVEIFVLFVERLDERRHVRRDD